jgi:hypothetical protein
VRVIITTNFDRLLELALEEIGIRATVIWNADTLTGAVPIAHSTCTIVKIHGDYLDSRIKNSTDDLAVFEPEIDRFLDRIFEDYGLILCGWSADYDLALRAALLRVSSPRYPAYWTPIGTPSSAAREIIAKLNAVVMPITGAESFFPTLAEKVSALDDLATKKPLTTKIAVATAKRLMSEPRFEIRLHDLIIEQIDYSLERMESERILNGDGPSTKEEFQRRLFAFERETLTPISLYAEGAYWNCSK